MTKCSDEGAENALSQNLTNGNISKNHLKCDCRSLLEDFLKGYSLYTETGIQPESPETKEGGCDKTNILFH